jgi:hypothetical protein
MKNISNLVFGLAFLFPLIAAATLAQPVPIPEDQSFSPQVELAGSGIGTLGLVRTTDRQSEAGINFTDSALLVGASQRLYDDAVGSFVFGNLATDAANSGTNKTSSYFTHQSFVNYQSQRLEVLMGRTDNQIAHIVDFPTLRGDDLVTLTNPTDPFSNGVNTEEHRYANVASVTLNQNFSYFENFHVQHLISSSNIGSDNGINSAGITFQYLSSPGLENFSTLPSYGLGYEYVKLDTNSGSGLNQIYGGATITINKSVTNLVDLRFQDILSLGSNLGNFQNITDTFQADSNAVAFAIRYLNKPFGGSGYQLSLTGAYKNYLKVSQANSFGFALTTIKTLGQGFDLVSQFQGQTRSSNLSAFQTPGVNFENTIEIGLAFNFDALFNKHINPRRSLLNQQHQYVPN